MTTYTALARLPIITPFDPAVRGAWGPLINSAWSAIEQAAMGNGTIDLTGLATYSVTVANDATDQARQAMMAFTGTVPSGGCIVTIPPVSRIGWASNATTQPITLTAGGATNLVVPAGQATLYTINGNAVTAVPLVNIPASTNLPGVPTAATAAPGTNTTQLATTAFSAAAVAVETARAVAAEAAETTRAKAAEATNSGRNRLDNGDFEVLQRGTTWSVPSATAPYTADRWQVVPSGFTAAANVFTSAGSFTSRRWLQLSGAIPAGGYCLAWQKVESANCYDLSGQSVTVSFTCNYSISAGATSFSVALYAANALDDWTSFTQMGTSISFTPSGSIGTYAVTFPALSSLVQNGLMMVVSANQTLATGNLIFNITSVQVEAGSIATPFERRRVEANLGYCQRYYQLVGLSLRSLSTAANAVYGTTLTFQSMRATPAGTIQSNGTTLNTLFTGYVFQPFAQNAARYEIQAAAAGDCYALGGTAALVSDL